MLDINILGNGFAGLHFLPCRQFHFTRASLYADLTDSALDELVQDIVAGNGLVGPEAVRASLRASGLCVQRRRVRASMLRINPGAAAL